VTEALVSWKEVLDAKGECLKENEAGRVVKALGTSRALGTIKVLEVIRVVDENSRAFEARQPLKLQRKLGLATYKSAETLHDTHQPHAQANTD
jgi:hypothetical protein